MQPKRCYRTSPMRTARLISPPCPPLLRLPVFGWLSCVDLPIGGQFTPPCILFSLILGSSIRRPKRWDSVSPRAPPPARHLSRIAFTNNAETWLVVVSTFQVRPLNAKTTPIALLFDGVCVGIPNEGTDCGAAKTSGASLAWTRGKTLRRELGP